MTNSNVPLAQTRTDRRLLHLVPLPRPWHQPGHSLCGRAVPDEHLAPFETGAMVRWVKNERLRVIPVVVYKGRQRKVCHLCMSGGEAEEVDS